jgi:hypothetical protein
MKKTTEQIKREIQLLTGGPRRIAHVGYGEFSSSRLDLPVEVYGEQRQPTRAQRANPKLPAGEIFTCMNRHGKVLGTSKTIQGAMQKAPNDKSYAKVNGEYTSDGHHWGPGRGRSIATREGGKWQMF